MDEGDGQMTIQRRRLKGTHACDGGKATFSTGSAEAKARYLFCGIALTFMLLLPYAPAEEVTGPLAVFHAGSLSVPLKEVASAFVAENPGIEPFLEAAGSRECARKITDLGRSCDVLVSSDYAVIDALLIPQYADWNIRFAGNEIIIAHTASSRYAGQISAENWSEVLLRDDVAFGRSEPNADPCGYRTLFTVKLAEKHYRKPGLAKKLLEKDTRYIRSKETDLLALLETSAVDYIFIYRSVAQQHGLKWITLPDAINLKNPAYAPQYREVSVELSGTTPGSVLTQCGDVIAYGVTVPKNAPNPTAARAFVAFLLQKDKGMTIMEKNGQESLVPAPSDTYDRIPPELKEFARKP